MTKPNKAQPSKRTRSSLLASAVTLAVAGGIGAGAMIAGNQNYAFADPVRVDAPAPADFSTVVSEVTPAVVSVQVKTESFPASNQRMERGPGSEPFSFRDIPEDHPFNEFFKRFEGPNSEQNEKGKRPKRYSNGQGSGFFISDDGYIVTNHHVVANSTEVMIIMSDGTELDATVIGSDPKTDLALLKVEGDDFTYVTLANELPQVGQWVVAVGNPFGLGGSVTAGIVSAHNRDINASPYDDFIQIDAPVNRGNSGGPTFNTKGEVIGVNTAIFSPSGGNVGIAFAIPATTVDKIISDLQTEGSVTRGWLGVQIQPVSKDIAESLDLKKARGALVALPQEDGPAAEAGIEAGDVILKVDGKSIKGPSELARMIGDYRPDKTVEVTIWRGEKEKTIEVKLGLLQDREASADADEAKPTSLSSFGLELSPNTDGDGVVVTGVAEDSEAGEKGIRTGDVIVTIAGDKVDSVKAVEDKIASVKETGRGAVLMQVEGERGTRFVAIPFDQG